MNARDACMDLTSGRRGLFIRVEWWGGLAVLKCARRAQVTEDDRSEEGGVWGNPKPSNLPSNEGTVWSRGGVWWGVVPRVVVGFLMC